MPSRSVIRSAQKAVVAALRANLGLLGVLGDADKIQAGKPTQKPRHPWIQVGSVSEQDLTTEHKTFDLTGKEVRIHLGIFSDKITQNDEVAEIYELVEGSLHDVVLVVPGKIHLLGSVRLVTILLDPKLTVMHGSVTYEGTFYNA